MKLSLIIIFIVLFFTKNQESESEKYEINTFIKFLQENGLWDVFYEIKNYFGIDVC